MKFKRNLSLLLFAAACGCTLSCLTSCLKLPKLFDKSEQESDESAEDNADSNVAIAMDESVIAANDDATRIRKVVNLWNKTLNDRDAAGAQSIFADNVLLYTQNVSKEKAISMRIAAANQDPTWTQEIITPVALSDLGDGRMQASFTKQSNSSKGSKQYDAFLILEKIDGEWKIVKESDPITEQNVAKRKNKVPNDAVRGDFDGDGKIDYIWIEAKRDSYGYLVGKAKLCSDNPKLTGLTWEGGRGVMLLNLGDLNGTRRDFIGAIPYSMSAWCTFETYGFKDGKLKSVIPAFTIWTVNEDYLRVKRGERKGSVIIGTNDMADTENGFDITWQSVPLNW